jgi:hypothetical protein
VQSHLFSFIGLDKKPFSDWQWKDVRELMKADRPSYVCVPNMSFGKLSFVISRHSRDYNIGLKDGLPQVNLDDKEIQLLLDELKKNKAAFNNAVGDEMTCREFISYFLTAAGRHLQSVEQSLRLYAEYELNGTRAYGPVDYTIRSAELVVCVIVVKKKTLLRRGWRRI